MSSHLRRFKVAQTSLLTQMINILEKFVRTCFIIIIHEIKDVHF